MISKFFSRGKYRGIALALCGVVLCACVSVALAGTLAAPGDIDETFECPYPNSYLKFVIGVPRTFIAIDAYYWNSSDAGILQVVRDPLNYSRATVTALKFGTAAVVPATQGGMTEAYPGYVHDLSNIMRYQLTGGNNGYIANVNGGTTTIPISVWDGNNAASDPGKITWVSLDTDVALVNQTTRVVTAMGKDGYAVIRGECTDPWGVVHYILYRVAVGAVPNPNFTITGVTVSPDPASVNAGESRAFTASVQSTGSGAPNRVIWEVVGGMPGTVLTNVTDTQATLVVDPLEVASTLTLRATSTADPKVFKNVTVTIGKSYTITGVTVSPSTANLNPGNYQLFGAQVIGSGVNIPGAVTWQVIGNVSSSTIISTDGLLSVAANETSPFLIVRATSAAEPSKYGDARVYLSGGGGTDPITSFIVSPAGADVVKGGAPQQYTATILPSSVSQAVIWSLTGATSSGTGISSSGLLTVAADESATALTVTATSVAYPTRSASVIAYVKSASKPITEVPDVVDGRTLDGSLTGDGTWIEIARNGDYSLIVRQSVLPIGAVMFDAKTNYYANSSVRNDVNNWFKNTLSGSARLRNFTVVNDCMNKPGAFASLANYGYSKPSPTPVKTGDDVAFLLSFAEASSFCSKQYATSTTTFATSSAYAQSNYNKLIKPGLYGDFWWLRSPGHNASGSTVNACSVGSHTQAMADLVYASTAEGPYPFVRPALWVHQNIFNSGMTGF